MNAKLEQFKKRNKKRNAHLYAAGLTPGKDYIVCPVSQERLSMIKTSYINKVLMMSVEEYDSLYPGIRDKVSERRMKNISEGLSVIDPTTGKTKYQLTQEKSKVTLSEIGDDGISGYKRKGQKTRDTHLSKLDEHGKNGFQRLASYRKTTYLEDGLTVEQHSHIKRNRVRSEFGYKRKKAASKASKKSLAPIIDILISRNIKFYFDDSEYGIRDSIGNNYYYYDLVIPELQMAVEFQGSVWHSNPEWPDEKWNSWTRVKGARINSMESIEYDHRKARSLYVERKILTYYVWEDTQKRDVELIITFINKLLESMNVR